MTLKLVAPKRILVQSFGTIQSNMTLKLGSSQTVLYQSFGTIQSNMTLKPQIGFIQSSLGRRNL